MAMAQVSRITGVVVSAEDNEPIVGASVLVDVYKRQNQFIAFLLECAIDSECNFLFGQKAPFGLLFGCLLYTSRCV